jgi:UDP-N-acetylglucosamine--dolichyl-phosphate N-acetylglucosaminephosphotransferase
MLSLLAVLAVSFAFTYVTMPWFMGRLTKAGITGKDMNKPHHVVVPEMGGFAIIGGFIVGVLFIISLTTFHRISVPLNLTIVLAGLSTVILTALIGVIDDLLLLDQRMKAVLPIFAALPLVAVRSGVSMVYLPFFGNVDLWIFYPLVLVPLAITGASNATNMLAGFNGLEAGLGVVMCSTIGFVAYRLGNAEALIISLAMLGALLAFLRFNWYPAKILIGDVGTLSIGAVVATSVIIGNIEKLGVILILPFFAELYLKARGGLKEQSWCKVRGEKLVCEKKSEVYGLGRLVMYLFDGVSEERLVLTIIGGEVVFALIGLYSFFGFNVFGL